MTWWERLLSDSAHVFDEYGARAYDRAITDSLHSEPRCPDCGWLYKRVTTADGQCVCEETLIAEIILEDILDAEVIDG